MNSSLIVFCVLLAVAFIGTVIFYHSQNGNIEIHKSYLSVKVCAILAAIMFVFVQIFSVIDTGSVVGAALGVLYHLLILFMIPRIKATDWGRNAAYGWIALDVACGIMSVCGVDIAIAMPVRLGGHVLCGLWLVSSSLLMKKDALLRWLGVFIGFYLMLYSFFGGVLSIMVLLPAGILVIIWLLIYGCKYPNGTVTE